MLLRSGVCTLMTDRSYSSAGALLGPEGIGGRHFFFF